MSTSCEIFFNRRRDATIAEERGLDVDIFLSHDYEDDQGIPFSRYSCELSLHKLLPQHSDRVVRNFVERYSGIRGDIDYSELPILVYDMQELVGFIDAERGLAVSEESNCWRSDSVMMKLVERMKRAS